jgi:hypothetical protein
MDAEEADEERKITIKNKQNYLLESFQVKI